jgi:hypothetical protein
MLRQIVAPATADASADDCALDSDRVPNVPLLDAWQDNVSLSSSGGSWNSDVPKVSEHKTRHAFIDEEGSDGSNRALESQVQIEDEMAVPATLAGKSVLENIFAHANVKNHLAAFGIEDFDGLDDSTKFGLSAISMGMKTLDRQRQAVNHLQSANNQALRKSPQALAVGSNDMSRVRVPSSSSLALKPDSSLRLKTSTRNPREKVGNALPASAAAASSRRRDISTASPSISDGNQNSPYVQSSGNFGGKAERELNIPTFDFHRASDNRRVALEANASSNSFVQVPTPVSKTNAPMRLEGPRSGPFVAWNDEAERFDDSDIEAIFGSDDVSAAGLRAIMHGSSSPVVKTMPRKSAQLGRRNTRE